MHIQPGLVPRYHQLKEILEQRIRSGEFRAGQQFPTDEALCAQYGLSRGTVRRAVDGLVEAGLLRREQGRGTFVTTPQLSPVFFRLASFDDDMRQRGREPETLLLRLDIYPADSEIAARLQLRAGEEVIEIARLRLANGTPMAFETRYLPRKLAPDLVEEDLERQSIHSLLIDKFNIPLLRAWHTIEARLLTGEECALLQAEPGTAGFAIERLTYTTNNQPVTWYKTIYRGDEYRFTAEFQHPNLG